MTSPLYHMTPPDLMVKTDRKVFIMTVNDTSVHENVSKSLPSLYPSGYTIPHIVIGATIISIIILMIIVGNFLVMWAIVHDRTLKTTQNLFIGSLAFADFCLGLIVIPFSLIHELIGEWKFGFVWCELYKAIDVLLCTASIMSLCLIALDRYWSITRAITYARQRTRKRAGLMIFTVWFISALVSIPPLIGWNQSSEEFQCNLSEDIGYVMYSAIGSFFIPAFIMVFVYIKIYKAAKLRARKSNVYSPQIQMHGEKKLSNESSFIEAAHCSSVNRAEADHQKDQIETVVVEISSQKGTPKKPSDYETFASEDCSSLGTAPSSYVDGLRVGDTISSSLPANNASILDLRNNGGREENLRKLPYNSLSGESNQSEQKHNKLNTPLHNVTTSSSSSNLRKMLKDNHKNGAVKCFKIVELRNNGKQYFSENDVSQSPKPSALTKAKNCLYIATSETLKRKNKPTVTTEEGTPINIHDAERLKRKLAKSRERRATVVLGLVMAAFILCWLPFFVSYLVNAFCSNCIFRIKIVFSVFFWIGYCNSAINPIIYTVFNRDFRRAFEKILFGKRTGQKLTVTSSFN